MSNWNGDYETARENTDELEDDIMRQMDDSHIWPTESGGTGRYYGTESGHRYDIYTPDSYAPKGHDRDTYNIETGKTSGH